jgi:hypothetical protein
MPASIQDLFPTFYTVQGPTTTITGKDMTALVRQLFSYQNGLTALSGGGQTGATPVTSAINEVSTVATTGESVQLPVALPGAIVTVINDGANSLNVFGYPLNPNTGLGDTIAAHNSTTQVSTTTGTAQASGSVGIYICFASGDWKQVLLT